MSENRPTYKEYEYPFDKINTDIVAGYIATKNREAMLTTGTKPYYTAWEEVECPILGKYMVLSVYEWIIENRRATQVLVMRIIPVDSRGRIVQTKDQRKMHTRIVKALNMEDDMIKAGITIMESTTKTPEPNWHPIGEPTEPTPVTPNEPVFNPEETQ